MVALVVGLMVAGAALWPSPRRQPSSLQRLASRRGGVARGDARSRDDRRGPTPFSQGVPRSRWLATTRRVAFESALAELVAALGAPLRAGVAPSVALAAAESACGANPALGLLLAELVEATGLGVSPAEVWLRHAETHDSADLRFVGQAWALSERTGAPLADALASGEEVLRARARARERLAAAAAGPRASMAVLCLLPVSGPVVGAAMGVDPGTLYFSSSLATASLVLGLSLAAGAWWWSRRILRRAT